MADYNSTQFYPLYVPPVSHSVTAFVLNLALSLSLSLSPGKLTVPVSQCPSTYEKNLIFVR